LLTRCVTTFALIRVTVLPSLLVYCTRCRCTCHAVLRLPLRTRGHFRSRTLRCLLPAFTFPPLLPVPAVCTLDPLRAFACVALVRLIDFTRVRAFVYVRCTDRLHLCVDRCVVCRYTRTCVLHRCVTHVTSLRAAGSLRTPAPGCCTAHCYVCCTATFTRVLTAICVTLDRLFWPAALLRCCVAFVPHVSRTVVYAFAFVFCLCHYTFYPFRLR